MQNFHLNFIISTTQKLFLRLCYVSILLLVSIFDSYGQPNWDYVNFPSSTQYTISEGSCIDANDNIYTLERAPSNFHYRLAKYNNGSMVGSPLAMPSGVLFSHITYNHITHDNTNTYLVGDSNFTGLIYSVDQNMSSVVVLEQIAMTDAFIELQGVTVHNNELYVVGNLKILAAATTATADFGDGSPWTISQATSFVAKYSLTSNQWVWKKKILGGNHGSVEDVAIDMNNNVYVTGEFRNALTVYDNTTTPYTFTNSQEHNYLLRFDNNGGFDATWGVKQEMASGNEHRTFDVKIDPDDSAVYYLASDKIMKHSTVGSGSLLWTKQLQTALPGLPEIYQIALNDCEELYATGTTGGGDVLQLHICGGTFFAIGMNKLTGVTTNNWVSNSTSSESRGTAVLTDSNDKVHISGCFGNGASPECYQSIVIDVNHISTTNLGTFLGRIDDIEHSDCCVPEAIASFINPLRVTQMGSFYGDIDVAVFCDELFVDGSSSECESGYFIGLSEFDLQTWTDINVLHAAWVTPSTQAPNNINIKNFIPTGYQFKPNTVYNFRLAVGNPWDATDIWFMVDCCCDDFVSMILNTPIATTVSGTTVTFTPPTGLQTNADVYWDFDCNGINDAVSQGNGTVSWTYPSPGNCNYVACMTAENDQNTGDICRAKQTKFVTINENCESCLYFDGSDGVSVPSSNTILDGIGTDDFTFEAKIKAGAAGQNIHPTIFSNKIGASGVTFFFHNQWSGAVNKLLCVQIGGQNHFIHEVGGGNNGIDLFDDVCHHIAVSKSGTMLSFYIDGALIGTKNISNANIATGGNVSIGNDSFNNNGFLGNISDLRIWNVARTQSEIEGDMNMALNGSETGLVANWPLNDGTGQNVVEKANNHNGILGTSNTVETNDPVWGYDCCETVCATCNQDNTCCKCDEEFYHNVSLGFSSFFNGLTGIFTPIGDFDQTCDNIAWIWNDNTPNDNTLGNQNITHTFPNDGIYNVCMIVYRDIDQDGVIDCEYEHCEEVEVIDNTPNSCLHFDNMDKISVPNSNTILDGIGTDDFTFEAKIKAGAAGQNIHPTIFSNRIGASGVTFFFHNQWNGAVNKLLCVQIGGQNHFIHEVGGGNNGIDLFDDVCHHIAVSKSGTMLSFYIDGALIGTKNISNANIATGGNVSIGNDSFNNNGFLGNISDLRIWNVARTQSEIEGDMNMALNGSETGLVANWSLNDGTGQNVVEIANNHNGVLGTDNTVETSDPVWGYDCCETVCATCNQDDTCCKCDEEFYFDISLGLSSFFNGLTGSFAPIGDFDENCDSVDWIWGDNTPNDNTLGNQSITHTFANDGVYFVCMVVYRDVDQNNEADCFAEYCEEIEVVTCTNSTNLWETDLTCNGVVLHWNAIANAQAYQLRGGLQNSNTFTVFPQTTATFKTIANGLQSNTSYQWSIRTKCNDVWTSWYAPHKVFTTLVCLNNKEYNPIPDPFANKTDAFFEENTFTIYPNPTQSDIYVYFNSISAETTMLKVVDIFGKTVLEKSVELQKGDNDFQLQVENFKAGTYFLEIESERGRMTKKFFVL
ncbi:MAG: LamG-like jellyroll fold domain-containing protein [Chitinophagales bacterium]